MVNSNCDLKICDFGLARSFTPTSNGGSSTEEFAMTGYVETRWYRAPEVSQYALNAFINPGNCIKLLLMDPTYDESIDIWATGCIFAELLRRKPIFPGDDGLEQIYLINKAVGPIPKVKLNRFAQLIRKQSKHKRKGYCKVSASNQEEKEEKCPNEEMMHFILKTQETHDLRSYLGELVSDQVIELTKGLLHVDPGQRLKVEDALQHSYFNQLHCKTDEPQGPLHTVLEEFGFEDEHLLARYVAV